MRQKRINRDLVLRRSSQ